MDTLHIFLAIVGTVIEVAVLGLVAWCSVQVAYSTAQVEATAKEIAAMISRDEKMIQAILQRVYDMQTRH